MTIITTPSPRAFALSTALTLALGLFATAPPASAAVTYIYTGTVSSGVDETGVFGLAGQNLAGLGLAFTATFVRDDLPGADYYGDPTFTQIAGIGVDSPVQGTITINGRTHSFGSFIGQQFQAQNPDGCGLGCESEEFAHDSQDHLNIIDSVSGIASYVNNGMRLGGIGNDQDFLTSRDYHTLSSLTSAQGVDFFGSVLVHEYMLDPAGERLSYRYGRATLAPTSLTVSGMSGPVAGVPEPASWALMILGFGSAGAMLRARRRGLVRA